jgi:rhomboid protease GluP
MRVNDGTFRLVEARRAIRQSPCTTSMLVVIWAMFAVEIFTHALRNQAMLLRLGALSADTIRHNEYWRLVTYALLHSAWWHIGLNTFLLLVAGPVVERTLGARSTTVISLLGAILGGIAILVVHHGQGSSIELGASGAFFALLAAALVMTWKRQPSAHRRLRTIVIVGILISFIPGISMAAHLAGLAIGCALALAMRSWAKGVQNELDTAKS